MFGECLLEESHQNLKETHRPRSRPHLLNSRDKRILRLTAVKLRQEAPNFTAMKIVERSGVISSIASYSTFMRELLTWDTHFVKAVKRVSS